VLGNTILKRKKLYFLNITLDYEKETGALRLRVSNFFFP